MTRLFQHIANGTDVFCGAKKKVVGRRGLIGCRKCSDALIEAANQLSVDYDKVVQRLILVDQIINPYSSIDHVSREEDNEQVIDSYAISTRTPEASA